MTVKSNQASSVMMACPGELMIVGQYAAMDGLLEMNSVTMALLVDWMVVALLAEYFQVGHALVDHLTHEATAKKYVGMAETMGQWPVMMGT